MQLVFERWKKLQASGEKTCVEVEKEREKEREREKREERERKRDRRETEKQRDRQKTQTEQPTINKFGKSIITQVENGDEIVFYQRTKKNHGSTCLK